MLPPNHGMTAGTGAVIHRAQSGGTQPQRRTPRRSEVLPHNVTPMPQIPNPHTINPTPNSEGSKLAPTHPKHGLGADAQPTSNSELDEVTSKCPFKPERFHAPVALRAPTAPMLLPMGRSLLVGPCTAQSAILAVGGWLDLLEKTSKLIQSDPVPWPPGHWCLQNRSGLEETLRSSSEVL